MARWIFLAWILGVALTVALSVVRRRMPPLSRRRWGPMEKAIAALLCALILSAILAGAPLGIIEFLKSRDAPPYGAHGVSPHRVILQTQAIAPRCPRPDPA